MKDIWVVTWDQGDMVRFNAAFSTLERAEAYAKNTLRIWNNVPTFKVEIEEKTLFEHSMLCSYLKGFKEWSFLIEKMTLDLED